MTVSDTKHFLLAEARYGEYRGEACNQSMLQLPDMPFSVNGVSLGPIKDDDVRNWLTFASADPERDDGVFPWIEIVRQMRSKPTRFEAAVSLHGELHGLAVGLPSSGNDNVTIWFMERCQIAQSSLKGWIAPIIFDMADNDAKILEKQRLKLKYPVESAIPYYEKLGFSLAESIEGRTYYSRPVE
jgi:hypothetical protein